MTLQARLIRRINKELPQVPVHAGDNLASYRGPKDGGQMSWFCVRDGRICSAETMTELVNAREIWATHPNDYRSNGYQIGAV